jgi:hypothetical protein
MSSRCVARRSAVAFLSLAFVAASGARAAFVNGVETFGGTTLDTVTWKPLPAPSSFPGMFTQNDGLTVQTTGTGWVGEYETRSVRLGVGELVRVGVRINALHPSNSTLVQVALGANDGGPSSYFNADSRYVTIGTHFGGIDAFIGGGGTAYGQRINAIAQPVGSTMTYELTRLSLDTVRFTVYTHTGAPFGRHTETSITNLPANLNVALSAQEASATFGFVRIVPIPEPAEAVATMSIASGALCLLSRPRRPHDGVPSA